MPEPGFLRDRDYLRQVQYRDGSRLADRAGLHAKYSTSTLHWYDFVLEQVGLQSGWRVLEVGCGPGWLWQQADSVVPEGIHLVLTDLSPGMVEEAVGRCRAMARFASVEGRPADAQELPFGDESFDVVVANHMLYHVPEPEEAVAEARRVLRPSGTFVAATNGRGHLVEIRQLRQEVFGQDGERADSEHFGADSGFPVLRRHFRAVTWSQFEDELLCTEPADVLAYLCSTPPADEASEDELERLRAAVGREFGRSGGVMRISKDVGLFAARRPREALA